MPRFSYLARDGSGTPVSGEVIARAETDAVRQLRAEGRFVVRLQPAELEEAARVETIRPGGRRVKSDEVIYFTHQLAGMIDTGVPIAEALEATIDGSPPGAFRSVVEDLIYRVQNGSDFSSALAAHPRVFPPLLIHMVRASEASGTLGAMLERVSAYLRNQRDLRRKIRGALTYPACMFFFAIGATLFLMSYVLPKFTSIYAGKEAVLPLPTRLLLGVSDWMQAHWLVLIVGTAAAVTGAILFLRTERGRYFTDWLRLHLPLLGNMFQKACLARSLRTLGTMIAAGVSVLDAVIITRDVVGNRLFGATFESVHGKLQDGEQLSQALVNAPFFPRPVWQMLHAGERTGQLSQVMERVADFCEADLKTSIRTVTQFIEPAMIVVVGSIIGTIAIAMLLPIFQISKVMTH